MSVELEPRTLLLPDLMSMCPLKKTTSPFYKKAGAESSAWIHSYHVFRDRKRAFFEQGFNELLVSHCYPDAEYEQFRTCCDFVNLLFVIDEVSDDMDGKGARATGQIYLDAMAGIEQEESALKNITRDFRARFMRLAGPNTFRRFLEHSWGYIEAVSREAERRERGQILGIEAFTHERRENSAVRCCFELFEYTLGIDLPDEVFEDPTFLQVYWAAVDMVCWANDVYSYDMEQAKGHIGNNVVTVLMEERKISMQEAADYVGIYFQVLMDRYMDGIANMPSWGPAIDADVARYVHNIGYWARGNLDWSFDTERYFGVNNVEMKTTRLVKLRPRMVLETIDAESP